MFTPNKDRTPAKVHGKSDPFPPRALDPLEEVVLLLRVPALRLLLSGGGGGAARESRPGLNNDVIKGTSGMKCEPGPVISGTPL